MCKTSGGTDPTDLASLDEEEDDGSVKLKEHAGQWEAEHNEPGCRDSSLGPEKKCDRYEPGSALPWKKVLSQARRSHLEREGTGALSHAAEQDACLLHENGSDQSMYLCPSPTDEGGDDLENMAASLHIWFDMEVLEAHESDNLDVVATTEQHSKTAFRSDVQIEAAEEVPDNSEFITSVDTRKVESDFAVRNVTELIVDDGQQADKGRKTRLNGVDGLVRGVKSAGRIERLLRNKSSFGGECAIPCDKQLCSFPTLSEQESGQTRQMDRD